MSQFLWYALVGAGLFAIGLLGLLLHRHLLRRVLALNVMGSGVFLIFVALARRAGTLPDPVPHAMVLTGLVVSVSATALALVLISRVQRMHGRPELPEDSP
jgi:multicomponent Na+:H+ antiporter subunit C